MVKTIKKIMHFEYVEPAVVAVALLAGGLAWPFSPGLAAWIWGLVALAGVIKPATGMVETLRGGQFGIDVIAVVAIVASVALHENLAAIVVLLMLTGGEALEDYAQRRARAELSSLLARAPRLAHRKQGATIQDIPVSQVAPQDILVVRPGETIPVDAKIVKGQTSLDESAITGESLPVDKREGDELLSGSVNTTGLIEVEALRASGDSQYARIVQLVQEAASSRSPLVRLADRYSVPFSIITFTLAGIAWALSGQALRALEVLVVATPCPLLIATPVALVSGMSRAARHGIIVKNGGALERLAVLKAVAFDKTGTLTKGEPEVAQIIPTGISKAELLRITASAERSSVHTLAQAVVAEARKHNLQLADTVNLTETPGKGVVATIEGKQVVVGKADFLHEQGIKVTVRGDEQAIQTAIFVAVDGKFAGVITFADALRPEAKRALAAIKALGVARTVMLTGDKQAVAERIAKRLGITDVKAECLPEDKVNALHALRNEFAPVAMVGDGVNDAPTLAAADVGIALGAKGSTAASESADVVIMLDDLMRVPMAIAIARRALWIAQESIWVGIGLSIVLMVVATFGGIRPVYGALLQEAVDVTVIINALRAHYGGRDVGVR
jgi:heavy metal translocating P-type ATPase